MTTIDHTQPTDPDRPEPRAHALTSQTLGEQFAQALAAKDFSRVADLLHPEVDFRGLTPNRDWQAQDPDAVIDGVLRLWFEPDDQIESVESIRTDAFADRELIGYRFTLRNPDGRFIVDQQAYLSARDGRIGWMRVLCSGCRPLAHADEAQTK